MLCTEVTGLLLGTGKAGSHNKCVYINLILLEYVRVAWKRSTTLLRSSEDAYLILRLVLFAILASFLHLTPTWISSDARIVELCSAASLNEDVAKDDGVGSYSAFDGVREWSSSEE